jgi:catechol 2,3-dioxygenase-like lactoylglutathione lyase family enzyme
VQDGRVLTAIDHLVIGVPDLEQAVATYRNLGFNVIQDLNEMDPRAAFVVFDNFFIELRVGGSEPVNRIIFQSDDLDRDVARLRSAGFTVADNQVHGHGASESTRAAFVDDPIPIGLIEHQTSPRAHAGGNALDHPNTATAVERLYVSVESIDHDLEQFERLLGTQAPVPELGTVIMSLMSVFYFGDVGVAVAEPRGPGPTADALATDGPGLFQVLFRADHLDQAFSVVVANGVPAPAKGTRLSGESAVLVNPGHACGLYIALAGMP